MSNSCNGEVYGDTVVDKEVQKGECAEALPNDPYAGTVSSSVDGDNESINVNEVACSGNGEAHEDIVIVRNNYSCAGTTLSTVDGERNMNVKAMSDVEPNCLAEHNTDLTRSNEKAVGDTVVERNYRIENVLKSYLTR